MAARGTSVTFVTNENKERQLHPEMPSNGRLYYWTQKLEGNSQYSETLHPLSAVGLGDAPCEMCTGTKYHLSVCGHDLISYTSNCGKRQKLDPNLLPKPLFFQSRDAQRLPNKNESRSQSWHQNPNIDDGDAGRAHVSSQERSRARERVEENNKTCPRFEGPTILLYDCCAPCSPRAIRYQIQCRLRDLDVAVDDSIARHAKREAWPWVSAQEAQRAELVQWAQEELARIDWFRGTSGDPVYPPCLTMEDQGLSSEWVGGRLIWSDEPALTMRRRLRTSRNTTVRAPGRNGKRRGESGTKASEHGGRRERIEADGGTHHSTPRGPGARGGRQSGRPERARLRRRRKSTRTFLPEATRNRDRATSPWTALFNILGFACLWKGPVNRKTKGKAAARHGL